MKNKKILKLLTTIGLIIILGTTVTCAKTNSVVKKAIAKNESGFLANINSLKELSDVMDIILENFVGEKEITQKELIHGALEGMMKSLDDPHSNYFSKDQMTSFTEDIKGEYAGVGMVVTQEEKYLTVVSPIEGTPSSKAGMKAKDKIIKIEETSTFDLDLSDCVDLLKGKPGTDVVITVLREGVEKPFKVTLKRAIIELKYVKYEMLEDKVGYLRITQFGERVTEDAKKAMKELTDLGAESIILDLRNNPGGALSEAIGVSSIFVEKSPIVTVRDKSGREQVYKSLGHSYSDLPIIVLVNEGSASASEIVAGAIKDHKRGLLLGEKTFGKGSVQNLLPLVDGDALKLTIAKYYTPSGECIHHKGIKPDIEVKEEEDYKFFEGFIMNLEDEEENKEVTKEINKEITEEITKEENKEVKNTLDKEEEIKDKVESDEVKKEEEEEEEKIEEIKDKQLNTALNVLKGIRMYKTK